MEQVLCKKCGEPFISEKMFQQLSKTVEEKNLVKFQDLLMLCPKCKTLSFAQQVVGNSLERVTGVKYVTERRSRKITPVKMDRRTGATVIKTICDRCHCECGVLVYVKEGKVVKIEGDPDFPQNEGVMCPKGLAAMQFLYHPDRLRYPMKRVGKRGEGKWKRISWDEALDIVATKFREILEKYGPESVTWSYGDAAYHSCRLTKQAWLYAMKSPTWLHSDIHYCYYPTIIANWVTLGECVTSEASPDYRNSKCIMLWGGNPVMSHPALAREIMIGKKRGAKLIVIDPRFTEIASKADIFLQIRPGTDAALTLGMLNVIINEELYDKAFVKEWCVGFEGLRRRVQEYPIDRVSEITWIPEEDIIQAARTYATHRPATNHTRMGLCMNINAIQAIRAVCIMAAICGNIDVKGGHILSNKPRGFRGTFTEMKKELRLPPEVENKRIGAEEFPLLSSSESPVGFDHPPSVIHAMLTGKPHPVKALWILNDLLLALEDSKETKKALMNLDFLVGSDFFMTPTLELCDVILPPCTYLERDDIVDVMYLNFIGARRKVIEPMYETRNEKSIDFEVIRRMGLKPPTEWDTIEKLNDYRLKGMGITFEDLKKKGFIVEPIRYKKYEEKGFNTPSKKVELYSTILEKFGYDPLPHYKEPPESPISTPELAKEYPLILITGSRHVVYFHSSNRQIPWLREIVPYPYLEIHPKTAEKLGIRDGDWVWIEGPKGKGRIKQIAKLTEAVRPEVVHAPSHWWYPEKKEPDHGCWDSNINVILSNDPPYDPICGATPLRGNLCKVYKVDEV